MALTLRVIEEESINPAARRADSCQYKSLTGQNLVPWDN